MARKSNVSLMTELHQDYQHITKDDLHILKRNWPVFKGQGAISYGNHQHHVLGSLPFIQIFQKGHQVYSVCLL